MKHLPFPRWRRKPECLPATGNFVPGLSGLRRDQNQPTWKAGTLPTELLPQNRAYFSRKVLLLSKGNSSIKKLGPDSSQIRYVLRM
jgi:hypothetical protein